MPDLESQILEYIGRPNYQPVKPRVIAKKLGISESRAADFKKAIKRLNKSGRLVYGDSHLVLPTVGHAVHAKTEASDLNVEGAVRAEESPETSAESAADDGKLSDGAGMHSMPYGAGTPKKPAKRALPNHITGL